MKIALIDPSLFTWPYDSALARALIERGHEVLVFGKHLPEQERAAEHGILREVFYPGFHKPPFSTLPKKLLLLLKGFSHVFSMLRLLTALRRWRPDVIHVQWTPLPAVDSRFTAALRRIAPTVLTVHDSMPFNSNPRSLLQGMGATAIMKRFQRVIVHTRVARERVESYGVDTRRLARIAHGPLDASAAAPVSSEPRVRAIDAPVTILAFGRIKPYKGVDLLIEAFGALPEVLRTQARLWIVGEAFIDTVPLLDRTEALGIRSQVDFDLRFVDDADVPNLFARSDVLALPYREIDASGVLMIALGAGLPIVASRIGLFAELLEDGVHGHLVPPGDVAALSAALGQLVEDRDLRQRMGAEVLKLHDSIPGWPEIARTTEALYLELIAEGAAS